MILAAALRTRNRIQIGASSSATCEAARTHRAHTHTTLPLTANQFIPRVDFSQRAPRLNLVRHTVQSLNGKESAPLVTFETLFTVAWPTFGRRVVLRADAGKHAPFCTTLAMNHSAAASQRAVERNTISDAHINSLLGHSRSIFAAALKLSVSCQRTQENQPSLASSSDCSGRKLRYVPPYQAENV